MEDQAGLQSEGTASTRLVQVEPNAGAGSRESLGQHHRGDTYSAATFLSIFMRQGSNVGSAGFTRPESFNLFCGNHLMPAGFVQPSPLAARESIFSRLALSLQGIAYSWRWASLSLAPIPRSILTLGPRPGPASLRVHSAWTGHEPTK